MVVVIAFMCGELEEVIFMKQLITFFRKDQENMVCRLLKSLYRLKQNTRQWNNRFDLCQPFQPLCKSEMLIKHTQRAGEGNLSVLYNYTEK